MTPTHHVPPETLISFAAGTLPATVSAVVACHIVMCRPCARDLRRLEAVGGILLSRLQPASEPEVTAARTLARLHAHEHTGNATRIPAEAPGSTLLFPSLLEQFPSTDQIQWRDIAPGVASYRMRVPTDAGDMRLVKLGPGKSLAPLGASAELVLVLQGALAAGGCQFLRGDIIDRAEEGAGELTVSGQERCICLVGSKPLRQSVAGPDGVLASLSSRIRAKPMRWQAVRRHSVALAASLAMIIGVGLGWLAREAPDLDPSVEFVSVEGNRLMTRDMLTDALETLPSGKDQQPSGHARSLRLGVRMTFQDQTGAYCRQYQITSTSPASYSGIACRKDGKWEVRFQALMPSPPSHPQGGYAPAGAGANAAMDTIIADWMSGTPLVGEEEAAVINKGWKP